MFNKKNVSQEAIFVILISKIQRIQHWIKELHFFLSQLRTKPSQLTTRLSLSSKSNNLSAHDTLSLSFWFYSPKGECVSVKLHWQTRWCFTITDVYEPVFCVLSFITWMCYWCTQDNKCYENQRPLLFETGEIETNTEALWYRLKWINNWF